MTRLSIFCLLLLGALQGILAKTPQEIPAYVPLDISEARTIADTSPLLPVEGIWTYPDDNVTVWIHRSRTMHATPPIFDITVLQSDDARLLPGTKIGTLAGSTDPSKFKLTLFSAWNMGILSAPKSFLATYRPDHEALYMEGRRLSLSFNPMRILPSFLGALRGFRIGYDDPLDDLPKGMIKIYPSYDGNGSSRRSLRYL